MPMEYTAKNVEAGTDTEIDLELPPECEVIFFNDDFTTMDFVVEVLVEIFNKSEDEAVTLMQTVHNNGSAVVGVYTYDIAVTKAGIATERAREKGFPLKIEVKLK